ncbi:hypothetical protein AUN00_00840 [Cronobacter sakazakii]|nr:hypothetical protein AUM96_06370 [Cronobacter sakazakii]PUW22339.1 hypothetical protein AUN00_00840 [Cronobacter sakazakii]VGH64490.1 Uncharacterised protein [Klebsiella pneumoniae]
MMSLWDALRMNMMISYQELVRTFPRLSVAIQRSIKNQSSQKRISSDITHCKRVMLSFGINLNDGDTDEPQT